MADHTFTLNLAIALGAALLGGLLARLARLPVLVGYLVAGAAVGPHTPGLVARPEAVGPVAELGVVLLMFAVGAHLSLKDLRAMRRVALTAGGVQIAVTTVLGVGLGRLLGWDLYTSLFLGCALALSSTAVMIKVLEERGELGTNHGAAMLGVLVVQDLSVIFMVALLPAIAKLGSGAGPAAVGVGVALLRAALFVGAAVLASTWAVPRVLNLVARTRSREVFILAVVTLCLATAMAAQGAGLGLELGAFIAGIVVSETDYAHEVFAQVRPMRDVFSSLFFVSVGMLLDPVFIANHAVPVALVVATIVVGKGIVSVGAVYLSGLHGRTSVMAGLGLAQIGEFSFVLVMLGASQGLVSRDVTGVVLSAALVTLLLAPFVYAGAEPLYRALNGVPLLSYHLNRGRQATEPVARERRSRSRVLLVGLGRVGHCVSEALRERGIPHTVIDFDAAAVRSLSAAGVAGVYGDATSAVVLDKALTGAVELAVVALPDVDATEMAVRRLRDRSAGLRIVVRVHRAADIARVRAAGASAVVYAEFEAATEMVKHALDVFGIEAAEVERYLDDVRKKQYTDPTD